MASIGILRIAWSYTVHHQSLTSLQVPWSNVTRHCIRMPSTTGWFPERNPMKVSCYWARWHYEDKQRVLMHGHQGWNVRHMRYVYIYIWVVYSLCFFCCLFITVTWWYVCCFEWGSGNQEKVQACLVTLWLFIISCYSLYKTTLGLLCSWFENNPHFHKYSMDFHV